MFEQERLYSPSGIGPELSSWPGLAAVVEIMLVASEKEIHLHELPVRLLVVDDNAAFRGSMRALLDKEPDLTLLGESGDGPTAIRLVGELMPDVVIMDVILPGMNGIEVTRRIIASYPSVKVIALSMHAEERFVKSMRDAGASGYVLKDQIFKELAAGIRAVAGGRTCFRGQTDGSNKSIR